jgi:hypothetical protein
VSLLRSSLVLAVLAFAGCGEGEGAGSAVRATDPEQASSTTSCAHLPEEQGGCGLSWEEHQAVNRRYAERHDFSGDVDSAAAIASEVYAALEPLADITPAPPVEDVRAALDPWGQDVQVADNAVGAAGTTFAVAIDEGCIFGSIYEGTLDVAVGGYIRDGGCLAAYAH